MKSYIQSSSKGFAANKSKDYVSLPAYDSTDLVKPFVDYGYFSNYAASFIGNYSTGYLTGIGRDSDLKAVGKSFTVECWIKLNAYNTAHVSPIISNRGSSSGGFLWYVAGIAATGHTGKLLFSTNGGAQAFGNSVLALNQWYHVAMTYAYNASNNATVTFYINGVLDSTTSGINTITAPNPDVATNMARESITGTYFLNGFIDEFRFWHVVRTEQEIRDNHKKTLKGNEGNLKSYFQFEEGSGDPLNKVTLTNAITSSAFAYSPNTPILDEELAIVNLLPTLDIDTQTYYNNVITNSGKISFKTLVLINEFVLSLKSNNLWDKMSEMAIFCGDNLPAALVKLKHRGTPYMTGTNLVSTDYFERGSTAGVKGNGSNKWINTNYTGEYTSNNAHLSAYFSGVEANGTSRVVVGHENNSGTQYSFIGWAQGGTWDIGCINATAGTQYTPQSQTQKLQGHVCITTNNSSAQKLFTNGIQLGPSVTGSGSTTATANIITLLCEYAVGAGSFSTRYLKFYSVGAGLSDSEVNQQSLLVRNLQSKLNRA